MTLSRRDLLTVMGADKQPLIETVLHISSAVVSVLPPHLADVERRLCELQGVEVHQKSGWKLVVVLEGDSSGALGARLAEISGWQGVLTANMVFEQSLILSELGE